MVICISGFARYRERHKMFALCKPGRRPTNMDTKYTQTKNCIVKMKSKLSSMHTEIKTLSYLLRGRILPLITVRDVIVAKILSCSSSAH